MRVNDDFLESLDLIRAIKPGIKTRAAAIEYCVDMVMMGMEQGVKEGKAERIKKAKEKKVK